MKSIELPAIGPLRPPRVPRGNHRIGPGENVFALVRVAAEVAPGAEGLHVDHLAKGPNGIPIFHGRNDRHGRGHEVRARAVKKLRRRVTPDIRKPWGSAREVVLGQEDGICRTSYACTYTVYKEQGLSFVLKPWQLLFMALAEDAHSYLLTCPGCGKQTVADEGTEEQDG